MPIQGYREKPGAVRPRQPGPRGGSPSVGPRTSVAQPTVASGGSTLRTVPRPRPPRWRQVAFRKGRRLRKPCAMRSSSSRRSCRRSLSTASRRCCATWSVSKPMTASGGCRCHGRGQPTNRPGSRAAFRSRAGRAPRRCAWGARPQSRKDRGRSFRPWARASRRRWLHRPVSRRDRSGGRRGAGRRPSLDARTPGGEAAQRSSARSRAVPSHRTPRFPASTEPSSPPAGPRGSRGRHGPPPATAATSPAATRGLRGARPRRGCAGPGRRGPPPAPGAHGPARP